MSTNSSEPTAASTVASPANGAAASAVDVQRALRWALYLGMSWTWVIGMFLPVLLIRDFGPWAWFAFAIPNIVGAAAMGWLITSVEHGVKLVENHRNAARMFSLVTIAFHIFFLLWLVPQLIGIALASVAFCAALLVMADLFVATRQQAALAAIPLIVSLICAMTAAGRGSLGWPDVPTAATPLNIVGLIAVCTLGFLTCPYLDLTFHRARQACRADTESKLAFGIGFGVVFGAMIIFTLLYAGAFINGRIDRVLGLLIGIHLSVQAIYTVGIHAAALRDTSKIKASSHGKRNGRSLWLTIAAAVVVALVARTLEARGVYIGRLGAGEVAYRCFMSFYGLIAPAYVWLCIHGGRGFLRPHRNELRMMTVACLLAAPFYWLGFMHGPMSWVIVGVLIVIGARFALDLGRRDLLAEQRASMGDA